MTETELKFSKEHEWIRLTQEGGANLAVVGISQFAQEQLNDIVSVELPEGHQGQADAGRCYRGLCKSFF